MLELERSSSGHHLLVTALLLGLTGCAPAPPDHSLLVERDSAGVRIVDDARTPENVPTFTVAPDPLYRIGWGESDPRFERIESGILFDDGRAVLGDAGSRQLYLVTSTGQVAASFGGPGGGPEELSSVGRLVPIQADSFLVTDIGNQRISHFSGPEFRSSELYEPLTDGALYGVMGVLGQSDYLFAPTMFVEAGLRATSRGWNAFPIYRGPADLGAARVVLTPDLIQAFERDDWNPVRYDGRIVATGDRIAHAITNEPEIRWYDGQGELVQIARWSAESRETNSEDWDAYEQTTLSNAGSNAQTTEFQEMLAKRKAAFGGTVPLFHQFVAAVGGSIWLGRHEFAGLETQSYLVMGPDGVLKARIEFPRANRLLAISGSHVLVVESDEFGVEAAAYYRLPETD